LRTGAPSQELAQQADLKGVPFFAQKEYECGPAALAMVMNAAGVAITPDELVGHVYLPARKGSLQVEMLAATRKQGLLAYPLQPALKDLLQEVAAGHPVLVFQNVSLPVYPVWHYAVVIAYDLERNTITLHSGETERLEMSLFTFERVWARGHYWAMLALKPEQLPATADARTFARTVAALEVQHPDAARIAYTTALQRWPREPRLLFGLGNSSYALKDLSSAALAYQQAVVQQVDFADAWNNLAQVQFESGQLALAKGSIAHAVALGGVRMAQYLELQAQIEATQ
jgi:ABC-type bacteriocin/lantibiotic exporter with double-glycine peptidase domain